MGSADDDDEREPKRPKPAYQVSHPTLAWESRTETIRAKPAPTHDHEPNPQEPNDSHNRPPRFELKEIDQLREREAQATPSPAPAIEPPPAKENAARPSERPRDYGELHRTHDAVRLDAVAVEMQRTLYTFDAKTEAFIAAEVKGMDVHQASDPVLRMELAFEWSIKQDLDPKGPPFATFEGSGFLDGERRKFYSKHEKALPRAQGLPAHVREAEDRKSAEQEAAKGGRTLTPAEQTHASPQLKATLDRKEREKRAIEMIRSRGDGRAGRDGRGGGDKGRSGGRGGR